MSQLIYRWRLKELSDSEFKTGLQSVMQEFSNLGPLLFQNIGLVIRERQSKNRSEDESANLWELVDDVDGRIRKSVEHFDKAMKV